jgi:hypothetical protein
MIKKEKNRKLSRKKDYFKTCSYVDILRLSAGQNHNYVLSAGRNHNYLTEVRDKTITFYRKCGLEPQDVRVKTITCAGQSHNLCGPNL